MQAAHVIAFRNISRQYHVIPTPAEPVLHATLLTTLRGRGVTGLCLPFSKMKSVGAYFPDLSLDSSPCITVGNSSAQEFLLYYPNGAYTTARTHRCLSVVDFDQHVRRLAQSAGLIFPGLEKDLTGELLRSLSVKASSLVLGHFLKENRGFSGEAKVVLLVAEDSGKPFLAAHASRLTDVSVKSAVEVCIAGQPRNRPQAKDSRWIRDRASLEEYLSPDVNEVLLSDSGAVYEGLTSNFFVVVAKDEEAGLGPRSDFKTMYKLQMAPLADVLEGTVLRMVQQLCHKHGIQLEQQAPREARIDEWKGAFITSTSRLVLPVSRIRYPDGSTVDIQLGNPLVEFLRSRVLEEIAARSVQVLFK